VHLVPRKDLLRGKAMFMDCIRVFSSITEREEDEYVFWELIYELWNQLWILQRKIPSLVTLIGFIVFNDSFRVKKLPLFDLPMECEKWGGYQIKNRENWPPRYKLCHFEPTVSQPYTLINQFKVCQMCCQANPMYSIVILNWVTSEWSWNCITTSSQREPKTCPSHVTIKSFLFQSQLSHYGLL